jgi:hypothetical protein
METQHLGNKAEMRSDYPRKKEEKKKSPELSTRAFPQAVLALSRKHG